MEEGSLRVDANVSARLHGATTLGTKTEVKNMNSISGVERALESEFARQCALLARGEAVHQQTMLWDGARGEVRPARSKEGSHDYRYFPEPDLPPLILAPAYIEEIASELPELPRAKRARFAIAVRAERRARCRRPDRERRGGRLLRERRGEARRREGRRELGDGRGARVVQRRRAPRHRVSGHRESRSRALLDLVRDGTVSHNAAKRIFAAIAEQGGEPRAIAERDGLIQERDSGALAQWVDEVLAENAAEAGRFLGGEKKLQGVLVGLVMKKSKGRADPKQVNQLLSERASRTGA